MLKSDLQDLILSQNPWLSDGKVPDHLAPPVERPLAKHLWRWVLNRSLKKYLVVLGPRRVGKTTVMYQTVRHLLRENIPANRILWVRLDHPELMNVKLGEIARFAVERGQSSGADLKHPVFLFLDELIYAENWDLWLKTFYDERHPVQIIASSSASAALHSKTRESGTGRWEEIHLFPYLLSELLQLKEIKMDFSGKDRLSQTIEQSANASPFSKRNMEQARRELIALGGFPEILSEQQNQIEQVQKWEEYLIKQLEEHIKEIKEAIILPDMTLLEKLEELKKQPKQKAKKTLQTLMKKEGKEKIIKLRKKLEKHGIEDLRDRTQVKDYDFDPDIQKLEKKRQDVKTGTSILFHKSQQTLRQFLEQMLKIADTSPLPHKSRQTLQQFLKQMLKIADTSSLSYKSQQTLRSIYKDILQSYRIDSPMALERFFYILAGQVTGLLSLQSLSGSVVGASMPTLERYLSYLRETYLIFLLPNYAKTEEAVQRRGRKIYFTDGAIRNAALFKNKEEIFDSPGELGKLQENLVAAHLHTLGKQAGIRIYHYRRKKYEVDFIYDDPRRPLAFEVGSSSSGHSHAGLREFLKEHKQFFGFCYYIAPGINFISAKNSDSGIGRLPLDLFLTAVGIQQERSLKMRLGVANAGASSRR